MVRSRSVKDKPMSSDTLRSEIARLKSDQADLRKKLAKEEKTASDSRATTNKKRRDAERTKSPTSQKSALSAAERAESKAADADKKVGDVSKKLADIAKRLATKERALGNAEKSEQRTHDTQDRARRRKEVAHTREIARLSHPPIQYVPIREPQPEKLRVLYLTANPDAIESERIEADGSIVREGVWLRIDREVRSVQKTIRGSKYRDLVEVHHMPAATREDVLEGLNDYRPHIIHFSGHGGGQSLLMESDRDDALTGVALEFDLLGAALSATTTPPSLIVLNACETLDGAEVLLNAIPIIIAMSEEITDDAAIVFAKQFYAAIASAQSVGKALDQARVAMRMAELDEDRVPQHIARDDVDIDALILVKSMQSAV